MVLLSVKGTKYPDEFLFECGPDDSLDTVPLDIPLPPPPPTLEEAKDMETRGIPIKPPAQVAAEYRRARNDSVALMMVPGQGIAPAVAHIQNRRHYLRLMLLSAQELVDEATKERGVFAVNSTAQQCSRSATGAACRTPERLQVYAGLIDRTYELIKDKAHVIHADKRGEFDKVVENLRQQTIDLFPEWCQPAPEKKEKGEAQKTVTASGAVVEEVCESVVPAPLVSRVLTPEELNEVVSKLYGMHENPDLGEDERLVVYHCRLLLDDLWREEDRELAGEAGLWFAGKLMTGEVKKYGTAKSKLIVRVANRKGPPPSGEPRMRYEDQRALFNRIHEKRETLRNLEESELRDRVVQQARGRVWLGSSSGSGGGGVGLDPDSVRTNVRPIYPQREERDVSGS